MRTRKLVLVPKGSERKRHFVIISLPAENGNRIYSGHFVVESLTNVECLGLFNSTNS